MAGVTLRSRPSIGLLQRAKDRWADLGAAAVLLVVAAFLLHQGRGTVFYFDEWSIWQGRYGASPDKWLTDVNGHLCAVPILIFTFITKFIGAQSLTPFRIVVVGYNAILFALLYVAAKRRFGGPVALAAVAPLSLIAGGWLDLLMPFTGIFVIGPLISAVGAYLLMERDDRVGDVLACVLLTIGIATGGGGIAVVAGFLAYVLVLPGLWRRLWVPLVPLAIYLIWRTGYHVHQDFAVGDLGMVLNYTYRGLSVGWGAYLVLGTDAGRVLATAAAIAIAAVIWRQRTLDRPLIAFVGAGVAYWTLIAIARGPEVGPEEVRYVYADTVFAVLMAFAAAPRLNLSLRMTQLVMLGAISGFALLAQARGFEDSAAGYRDLSQLTNADMYAFNTAHAVVDPAFSSQPILNAGQYLNARRYWGGPPGFTEAQLRAQPEKVRTYADTVLAGAFKLTVAPVSDPASLQKAAIGKPTVSGASVSPAGTSCWTIAPTGAGGTFFADFQVPPKQSGGLAITAGKAEVDPLTGRYDTPKDKVGKVGPGDTGALAVATDDASAPWVFRLQSTASFRVCGLARS